MLDRLLDVLVIDTLRSWYQQQADVTSWWDAHHDPLVGAVLGLIHDSPEEAWTIASLAKSIGTSRANLARRFNELVGEPPITYLTKWRLSLAADLLGRPHGDRHQHGPISWLWQRIRLQHRLQATVRHQPASTPDPNTGGATRST